LKDVFAKNHIDGEAFLLLKEEHLGPNELNISNLGERYFIILLFCYFIIFFFIISNKTNMNERKRNK